MGKGLRLATQAPFKGIDPRGCPWGASLSVEVSWRLMAPLPRDPPGGHLGDLKAGKKPPLQYRMEGFCDGSGQEVAMAGPPPGNHFDCSTVQYS